MLSVIADHPTPEMYALGLEIDCQCARCGSSCHHMDCHFCGGEGFDSEFDDCPEHPAEKCDTCDGRGGWWACLSSAEWCQANPVPGREHIERGQIEWFTVKEPA